METLEAVHIPELSVWASEVSLADTLLLTKSIGRYLGESCKTQRFFPGNTLLASYLQRFRATLSWTLPPDHRV